MCKILALSDLHGIIIPPQRLADNYDYDLIAIAGDILPLWAGPSPDAKELIRSVDWVCKTFYPWLEALEKPVVWTWGNHDKVGEYAALGAIPLPEGPSNSHLLVDSGVIIDGVAFWGIPWTPRFYDWAFNLDEEDLVSKWAAIPDDTNVLITHGPPFGECDRVWRGGDRLGSRTQRERLSTGLPDLQAVICGHIHGGRGTSQLLREPFRPVTVYNCAIVNEQYKPAYEPMMIEVMI